MKDAMESTGTDYKASKNKVCITCTIVYLVPHIQSGAGSRWLPLRCHGYIQWSIGRAFSEACAVQQWHSIVTWGSSHLQWINDAGYWSRGHRGQPRQVVKQGTVLSVAVEPIVILTHYPDSCYYWRSEHTRVVWVLEIDQRLQRSRGCPQSLELAHVAARPTEPIW